MSIAIIYLKIVRSKWLPLNFREKNVDFRANDFRRIMCQTLHLLSNE